MEEDQQKDGEKEKDLQGRVGTEQIPDLAMTLQALSLAEPGLCQIQDNQMTREEELDFSFCLLMKIACTGGTPRKISQQAVEQSMARAWRDRFYAISQVSNTVFMAHFRSQEDMISVYTGQPWVMNTDNLLIDWFDSTDNANSSSDYKFDTILVTVRAYGIPRFRRSQRLLSSILNQVGTVSEFHILQDNNLYAKQDYIRGTAKMKVNSPVKDRVVLTYADNSSGLAYLHYEKIKRICLFCGIMFHSIQNCNLRNSLIAEISKNKQTGPEIPSHRFGQWINDEKYIPVEVIQNTTIGSTGMNQTSNAILARLQKLFADDPKGKGKIDATAEEQRNRANISYQRGFCPSNEGVRIGQLSSVRENLLHRPLPLSEWQIGDQGLHARQFTLQQSLTQQHEQGMNLAIRGFTGGEGTSSQLYTAATLPMNQATNLQHEALLGQQSGQRITAQSRTHIPPAQGQRVGQPNILTSNPDTALREHNQYPSLPSQNSPMQELNPHQTPLATTTLPLLETRDPCAQPHYHAPSKPEQPPLLFDSTHVPVASTLQNSNPKRPAPNPNPSSPPLAKRQEGFDGAPSQPAQQIPSSDLNINQQMHPADEQPLCSKSVASEQSRGAAGANHPLEAEAGLGILGPGPRGGGSGGTIARGGGPTDLMETTIGARVASPEGRARRRPSGWDVEDSPQTGAHVTSSVGITHYQYGSATWKRLRVPNEPGQGGPHRRDRGVYLGSGVHPYSPSPRRSPSRIGMGSSAEYTPWPLDPVSPSPSSGTQDSRIGAFSPPQVARDYYVAPDVANVAAGPGGQEEVGSQIQHGNDYGDMQADGLQSGRIGTMESTDEAMAPAFKAPRAS